MSTSCKNIIASDKRQASLFTLFSATLIACIFYSPWASAVDLVFDGTASLISGTDCEAGAKYRLGTTASYNGKNLDLIVEITGDGNDYASNDVPGYECLGLLIDNPGDPELFTVIGNDGNDNGGSNEPWSTDLKFTIVEKGTETRVTVDRILLTAFDLDIKPGLTGTDNVFLTDDAVTYLDSSSKVRRDNINSNGPGAVTYTTLLLGTNQEDCDPATDISCRGAAAYTNISEFSLRVLNNKSDPATPRLFQFSFKSSYFDEMDLGADYGDAPASYGDAAAGVSSSPLLGAGLPPDNDTSPQHSDNALGDDTDSATVSDFDDDEGVTLNGADFSEQTLYASSTQTLDVSVYGDGMLNVFFDWNRDGDFDDPGEQVVEELPLTTGQHAIAITPPANAATGTSFARFRYCRAANSCSVPSGYADDGETEDYRFVLAASSGRSSGTAAVDGEIKTGLDGSGIGGFGWWILFGPLAIGLRQKNGQSTSSVISKHPTRE